MRVKRYIVEHMPDAMQRIRSELGRDAVILSTKEIKIGGFLGMFQKKRIEVVAAVEKDLPEKSKRPVQPNKAAPKNNVEMNDDYNLNSSDHVGATNLNVPKKAVPEAYQRTKDVLRAGMNDQAEHTHDGERLLASVATTSETLEDVHTSDTPSRIIYSNEKSDERNRVFQQQKPIDSNPILDQRSLNDPLLQEMKEMKLWIAKMAKRSIVKQELPESLQRLEEQLIQQEIDVDLREEWIMNALEKWEESGQALSEAEIQHYIRDKASNFLSDRLGGGIGSNTRVVYVAGPTGVGKTTTIAKLAAEQLFRYQRKVGFITSDTYRISAVEQLRTYASILNVPLEVVQSPADMQRAMQRLDYCDLILMDTAGRNFRNELLVSELQSLLSYAGDSETYLVLSLTSKSQDMMKITEHFSKYGLDKVIFTKQDETGSYGAIFNLIQNFPLHLSYMTNGQNVPEDLIMPNPKMLVDLLLGEREEES